MIAETYATLVNMRLIVPSNRTTFVAIDKAFLATIMAPSVSSIYVDESWYLAHSPDVEEAIARGDFESATDHYVKIGFYEHRMPYEIEVDEAWYLESYPDIAEAVSKGVFKSGAAHFYKNGFSEGRFPHPNFSLRVARGGK
jgi:hypothetical protein